MINVMKALMEYTTNVIQARWSDFPVLLVAMGFGVLWLVTTGLLRILHWWERKKGGA
jgi:hypothetical protein